MATTTRSNLVIPEILADAITTGMAGMKALMGTGAVIVNNSLPSDKQAGDTVSVPYFNTIGELEDVAENASLTPAQLTTTKETATVARSGKAIDLTRWAQMAALGDPYAEAARQFVEGVQRKADEKLITAAKATTLVADDSGNAFNYDAFVDAKGQFGDEDEDIALCVMHSAVFTKLLKLKDSNGRPLAIDAVKTGEVPTFLGVPVKKSDRLTPTSSVYPTLLVKKGALVFWYAGSPSVRSQPDVLKDSDLTSVNLYSVAYMYRNMPGKSKPGVVKYLHK